MITKSFSLDDPVHIGWQQSLESSDSAVMDVIKQLEAKDDLEDENTKSVACGMTMSSSDDTQDELLDVHDPVRQDESDNHPVMKPAKFGRQSSMLQQSSTYNKSNPDSRFVSVCML